MCRLITIDHVIAAKAHAVRKAKSTPCIRFALCTGSIYSFLMSLHSGAIQPCPSLARMLHDVVGNDTEGGRDGALDVHHLRHTVPCEHPTTASLPDLPRQAAVCSTCWAGLDNHRHDAEGRLSQHGTTTRTRSHRH